MKKNDVVAEVVENGAVADGQEGQEETTGTVVDEQTEETTQQPSLLEKFFSAPTEQQFTPGRGNQKAATADLTNTAALIMNDIIKDLMEPGREHLAELIEKSQKGDNDATDALVAEVSPLDNVSIEFLTVIEDTEELEKMLRSQQSKRSRAKKDVMTLEDYKTMLTAAIAEGLLRRALGKPKGSGGGQYDTSGFTDAEIEEFKKDEDKLAKAIRNVQSKKSIAKNKQGFDEAGDHWQHLLSQEAFLKNLRDSSKATIPAEVEEALSAKEAAEKLLNSVESIDNINETDAKELLLKLKETLVGGIPTEVVE